MLRNSAKQSSVAPAVRDNYITIIDAILSNSDLNKISEKKIRAGIQEKVEYDITPQKVRFPWLHGYVHERSLTAV